MTEKIKPIPNETDSKQNQIRVMFDDVSEKYDFINRIITFGLDKIWRKKIIKFLKSKETKTVVDLATGTGDMLSLLTSIDSVEKVYGIDISPKMLEVAEGKIIKEGISDKVVLELVSSEKLPVSSNFIDAVTIVYGIRNFENYSDNIKEIHRTLKKGGYLIILETSVPSSKFINFFYNIYVERIMPLIASLFSRNVYAYKYLGTSAKFFPCGKEFSDSVCKEGFDEVKITNLMLGVSSIYYFVKK